MAIQLLTVKRASALILVLISAVSLQPPCAPTLAAPSDYQQGVDLYKVGKFSLAISALETSIKATPNDASSHYYLALCHLALKQQAQARQQFEWVSLNSAEPTLKAYATSAMNALPAPGDVRGRRYEEELSAGEQAPPRKLGRCKVLMFETSWCHYCHAFAPHFDEVAAKNRSVMDFERLDAEKKPNIALREKYKIHSFPRLVYLDGNGNLLYNEGRAAFDQRVHELTTK